MDLNLEAGGDENPNDFKSSGRPEDERSQPHTGDGASPGKIFIGGLARETTSAQFVKYFSKYGDLTDSVIMRDRKSGQPRGFGFVTYADPSVVDRVIEDTHIINGKQVEIKRTIPKGSVGSKDFKTKKIFVGGIPTSVTEDEFREFFSTFGEVKDHQIMRDHSTNRSRGFGFVTFDAEETVEELMSRGNKIDMAGTQVEIKKAEPKKPNPPPSSKRYNDSRPPYGNGYGDAYGGYGGSGLGPGAGAGPGPGPYRSGGGYGGRATGAYNGYGADDFGTYGGYGGGGMGPFRGESSLGYSGRYGGGYSRGYNLGGGYGGPADSYDGYGSGNIGGGYGGNYDPSLGGSYSSGTGGGYGGSGGPFFGGRGGYGGAGGSRYHPYGR